MHCFAEMVDMNKNVDLITRQNGEKRLKLESHNAKIINVYTHTRYLKCILLESRIVELKSTNEKV